MKTWIKACFLGTIVFITLFTVSLIIGFFIMTHSGTFESGTHQPVKGQYHNPNAEKMINRMDKIRDEFNVDIVHDLDNHDDRLFLHKNGLVVKPGQTAHFQAIENPTTGYTWHIDHDECACMSHFLPLQSVMSNLTDSYNHYFSKQVTLTWPLQTNRT